MLKYKCLCVYMGMCVSVRVYVIEIEFEELLKKGNKEMGC